MTFFGGHAGAGAHITVNRWTCAASARRRHSPECALPDSPALPFLFAVSDLPEVMEPRGRPAAGPERGQRPTGEGRARSIAYRLKVEPGDKLLFELQARELGTSRLEAIITAYDSAGKKLDSAGDKPLPEDVFAIQGTSRTSSDPFLNLTVPPGVHEIVVTVEDLARRGGPAYGYRLMTRRQAEDFRLSLGSPFVNLPSGGTVVFSVSADRRGFDGPIQLTVADLPKGIHVDGGTIPREYIDASNARTFNRRGILTLTADPGVPLPTGQLQIWGEGKLADGTVLRRRARGNGMAIDVAGATEQGVVDRQRPVTAPWLNVDLPVALADASRGHARSAPDQPQADGRRRALRVRVQVDDARPCHAASASGRGCDRRQGHSRDRYEGRDGAMSGTFAVTTTKATDPARYDSVHQWTSEDRRRRRSDRVARDSVRSQWRDPQCRIESTVRAVGQTIVSCRLSTSDTTDPKSDGLSHEAMCLFVALLHPLPLAAEAPKVTFLRDVAPILNKVGCTSGPCHGAAKGKNGFKLSLRGYDPQFDYEPCSTICPAAASTAPIRPAA